MYKAEDNIFFHSKQCDPKQSQNHQLDWTDFTKNCTVGNKAAGHTEVSINQAGKRNKVKMLGRYEKLADCPGTLLDSVLVQQGLIREKRPK